MLKFNYTLLKENSRLISIIKDQKQEIDRLTLELEQKKTTIQYLNGCVNKANRRYLEQVRQVNLMKSIDHLSFPNSEVEGQISIHDILEN